MLREPLDVAFNLAQQDESRLPDFFDALVDADIFVVGQLQGAGDDLHANFPLRAVRDVGECIVGFTSQAQAERTLAEDTKLLGVPTRDLFGLLDDHPLLINPGPRRGLLMTADQRAALLDAVDFEEEPPAPVRKRRKKWLGLF